MMKHKEVVYRIVPSVLPKETKKKMRKEVILSFKWPK